MTFSTNQTGKNSSSNCSNTYASVEKFASLKITCRLIWTSQNYFTKTWLGVLSILFQNNYETCMQTSPMKKPVT